MKTLVRSSQMRTPALRVVFKTIICLLIPFTSCKKYLSTLPDNRANLNSDENITQFLTTAYPSANYMPFMEAMSDNPDDKGLSAASKDLFNSEPYLWKDASTIDIDVPAAYWDACYSSIATSNQALVAIQQSGHPLALQSQLGEALITRAYAHFMLVCLFSKFYDSTTAATDLGIPYVTSPETVAFKNYSRGTVKYDFDMIEADLNKALPLISDAIYAVPQFHFNVKAAHAFAARFYLFKRDMQRVVQEAALAFPGNNYSGKLRPYSTTYATGTANDIISDFTNASESANLLLASVPSYWARSYPFEQYGLTGNRFVQIYGQDPIIRLVNIQLLQYTQTDVFIPKFKEYFQTANGNPNIGFAYTVLPLFTTEEVLLSQSEAYANLGDSTNCLKNIQQFLASHIVNYSDNTTVSFTNSSGNNVQEPAAYYLRNDIKYVYQTSNINLAYIRFIVNLRQMEFYYEGLRWFDDLRFNFPVIHNIANGLPITLNPGDLRRTIQLPQQVVASGLPFNPR